MANVPETSTTLLKDLARDTQHARWGEFVARYQPMMESFMSANFPTVDAADAIQETLIALIEIFPVYHYVPDERGSFHNYLTGILRHKALKILAKESHRSGLHEAYAKDPAVGASASDADDGQWRKTLFEIALQQYMADDTVADRTKRIFARVAIDGEKPEDVAKAFGVERNAVDQIKSRSMARLRELVAALEKVEDARLGDRRV